MRSEDRALTSSERAAMGATAGDNARAGQVVDVVHESRSESILRVSDDNVGGLLLWATAHDRQVRGQHEGKAWLAHIKGIPYQEARDAITEYFRQARYPITPGDVISIIKEGTPL